MIRVVMFDLGMTLIDAQNRPFAHVAHALETISTYKTKDGKPLRSCLVSDFTMPTPPITVQKKRALFDQYLDILGRTGLRPLFEPVNRRVTLSTQAGVLKPDRKVFETAVRRLRVRATLEECLFVTESSAHISAARQALHMRALQFASTGQPPFDFDDWSLFPALIAQFLEG